MNMSSCGCSVGVGRSPTNVISQQGMSNPPGWGDRRSQSGLEHFQVTNTGVVDDLNKKNMSSRENVDICLIGHLLLSVYCKI